jgi:uncharacterized protein (TIGR02599 family)
MRADPSPSGFTLVEVMVSVAVSALTLTATLAVVLFITRTGIATGNYVGQTADARRALETIARDLRQASACTYNSATSLTLTVPDRYLANGNQITYTYDGSSNLNSVVGSTTTTLCKNVTGATFSCFTRDNVATTTAGSIKLVRLKLNLKQTALTTVAQDTLTVAASVVLRNKPAS